jgi:hypothetical protein
MNERIAELAGQAEDWADSQNFFESDYRDSLMEKFAELIIRECANRATWAQDTGVNDIGGEVLKHFGVRE